MQCQLKEKFPSGKIKSSFTFSHSSKIGIYAQVIKQNR